MEKFTDLGLSAPIIKAITELGFETPTPIQAEAIPYLINGTGDLVGLAQTGTGKTAAFGLPIVHKIDFEQRKTQAIIIAPTRELCIQITKDMQNYAKYFKNANIVPVYGGASIMMQIKDIARGAQIVVATPGRMCDIIDRKKVDLSEVSFVVLDEADEMLNMGFKEDLDRILVTTPNDKQTLLFSATMPAEVSRIAKKYMNAPHEIAVAKQSTSAENIEHLYFEVHERERYAALKRIIDNNPDIFGIVFCRTRWETQEIAEKLMKDGYNADALHGDLSQAQRDNVMKRYRGKTLQMLVATDVAARGIDVNNVTHVLNYNLPDDPEVYTHRSGRTARAGKSGVSIVIVNTREVNKIRQLERIINKKFEKAKIPGAYEICEKQLFHLVNKIHDIKVNTEEIEKYLPVAMEKLADLSKEELISKFVSVEFNRFLEYYRNAPDLNVSGDRKGREERTERKTGDEARSTSGVQRFFINVGEMDGMDVPQLADYVADACNISPKDVQNISLREKFTFFNVESQYADMVLDIFKKAKFNGRSIRVDMTEDRPSGGGGGGRSSGGGFGGGEKRSFGGGGGGYRGGSGGGYKGKSEGGSGGYRGRSEGGSGGGGYKGKSESGGGRSYGGGEKKDFGAKKSYGGGEKSSSSDRPRRARRD